MSKQATAKTSDLSYNRYREDFRILSGSSARVIVTPSREPYRTANTLREWAAAKDKMAYHEWDCLHGWRQWEYNQGELGKGDKAIEIFGALKKVNNVDGGGKEFADGLYVVHYPHWNLKQHAGLIQVLKLYAKDFASALRRMVLLVPEGFALPAELENDLVVLDATLPSKEELRHIYDFTIESVARDTGKAPKYDERSIEEILAVASGMTEMEFKNALTRSVVTNRLTLPNTPIEDFIAVISGVKTDVVKRSEVLEIMPPAKLSEIGGLDVLKEWLQECQGILGQAALDYGADRPKGAVLIGPPGTGKSLAAKVTASILRLPLVRFDVGRVFNSLVGASESRVRSALKLLDAMAPCVAFVDEVDKAGLDPRQGGGDSGVGKRIMGAILTHMQESQSGIFWIATANRVDSLPPELLRAGRFDKVFAVMPPNNREREQIADIHLRKRKQNASAINLAEIAAASSGYVAAEIEGAVKEAVKTSFVKKVPVTADLVIEKLGNMKPISEAFAADFTAMEEWAKNNATLASTPDDRPVSEEGGQKLLTRRKRSRTVDLGDDT
jgi:SpoVK/Ycf46/Vps4 family AAA+-type ATPase